MQAVAQVHKRDQLHRTVLQRGVTIRNVEPIRTIATSQQFKVLLQQEHRIRLF